MKKIALAIAVFALILLLTKIANQMPADPLPGVSFALKAQQVVQCTPDEITLMDPHQTQTHLVKDKSWPDCSTFQQGQYLDFYLARGEKTGFERDEKTEWWRTKM
jgi:hypothetical protein